ncbi:MAG: FKBP-type peptidyl-prolyl cis-trans isomerase [Flavobacteriia bacterium]|nr:FKBP-type peptidyl-prolyl cis-trans isomerase [Flavobacteriia bacterium]
MRLFLIALLGLMMSCQSTQEKGRTGNQNDQLSPSERRERLIEQNLGRVQQEKAQIEAYIDSSGMAWEETGTGLRFVIIDRGEEKPIEESDIVQLDYNLHLLDGTQLASSKVDGLYTVRANKDNDAVIGLHEALMNLHRGDSAIVLIPSHLAFGIAGEGNVPPMSSVLYYMRILK